MMDRPKNLSGNWCPLWRKRCGAVCHTCEFWAPMDVVEAGVTRKEYRCAMVWNAMTAVMSHSRLDGIQRATEGVRNQFYEFKQSILGLVGTIAQLPPLPPRNMGKVVEHKDAKQLGNDPA